MCSDSSVCGGGSCIDYGASYTCDCGEAGPGRGPSCDMDNVCRCGARDTRHETRDTRHTSAMVVVTVIGCGVLGSRVAAELGMCGHKVTSDTRYVTCDT